MGYYSRLEKAFEGAIRLPLDYQSKYVLFSDCHRGIGTSNDNFLNNQTLYSAALQYYYRLGYTYVELGDGDELWENRSMQKIIEAHNSTFQLLSQFFRQGRLYLLYGNHDMEKKEEDFTSGHFHSFPCCCGNNPQLERQPLFPGIQFHPGILLEHPSSSQPVKIFLTHGHQADLLNSTLWRISRFLVRYFWKPLERYGVTDPTSAAKNNTRKQKTEKRLHHFAEQEHLTLIAGHTHRPFLSDTDLYYCNSGSCVHPAGITCLEIEQMQIRLVKWEQSAGADMRLYVARNVLEGPVQLSNFHQVD